MALRRHRNNQVMFAAASNGGATGDGKPTYPAREANIICIEACDGLGNRADFNPRVPKGNSFMTLGVSVPSQNAFKSGTSFATPLAVAMVANALEFTRHKCVTCPMSDDEREYFHTHARVQRLMSLMSLPVTDNSNFLDSSRLWDGRNKHSDIAEMFQKAAQS